MDFGDLLNLDSPFNEATLKLEATKAINGDFNIEIAAAVEAHAECSFPGSGCRGSAYSTIGKNFRPSEPKGGPGFSVSDAYLERFFHTLMDLAAWWLESHGQS